MLFSKSVTYFDQVDSLATIVQIEKKNKIINELHKKVGGKSSNSRARKTHFIICLQ